MVPRAYQKKLAGYAPVLDEKWLFETLKEDVNHLQIVSGQEYID